MEKYQSNPSDPGNLASIKPTKKDINKVKLAAAQERVLEKNKVILSGSEFIFEIKAFLDDYYKGCYDSHTVDYVTRSIIVSPECFAEFLKTIFFAVKASQLIKIKIEVLVDALCLNILFDKSYLSENDVKKLYALAESSEFSADFHESGVRATFKYITSTFSAFYANSPRIVYNTLCSIFEIQLLP